MTAGTGKRLFADRNFRLYSTGSVISWLSFFVQTLAVSRLAWDLTHSPARRWLGWCWPPARFTWPLSSMQEGGLWFMVSQVSNVSLLAIGPLAERSWNALRAMVHTPNREARTRSPKG